MYVEDLVFLFANLAVKWSPWHLDFIHNVSDRVRAGRPLSVKQVKVLLDLARQYRVQLIDTIEPHVLDGLLADPVYRLMPYLYATFLRASETGAPVQRPLVFEGEEIVESYATVTPDREEAR